VGEKAQKMSSAKQRSISTLVATKPGCAPLKAAYARAVTRRPKAWQEVEDDFLRAMEQFDANVVAGIADMGDLQNGKGDFFNDLLALLLENCGGVTLFSRGGVPGLIFPKHNLDVTFPSTGVVQFMLEAKAVGTPKYPGNPRQKALGRPGSADLDKRVKEIGFKTIDLKAEYARIMTAQGTSPTVMGGDLTAWLRSVLPRSYVFIAARTISEKDRDRVVQFANVAGLVSDAVGVYCFTPISPSQPTTYRPLQVPAHLELARVLFRACQDLSATKIREPIQPPSPSPSAIADSSGEDR
jgi:hypothetical protein